MVVVVYDISSSDPAGRKRLYRVSKKCADMGVNVQNSVYECELDAGKFRKLKADLEDLICPQTDSVRFYLLGNRYRPRIETLGKEKVHWDRETYVI